ncbi:FAD:protein FMN transferase [Sphingobacterium paludis]|uniref:FAD:protein FMN transferase n=1 Tax=Sphingobacterium paludis TaxID=1476465 RepID=A0A4R7CVF5_9SPHI|nr:FAD:protein FMN transferase [Sphingobacterium paludis]TDS11837.1 thiamine biosynthesis lipoprotein [Sphingobacterium paludis]
MLLCGFAADARLLKFTVDGRAQGTTYHVHYYAPKALISKGSIDSALTVIDQSMSLYKKSSLISRFNDSTSRSVAIDRHMQHVVRYAFTVNKKSGGVFDITVKPLVAIWGFGVQRASASPRQEAVDSVLSFVGMDKLSLKGKQLYKKDPRVAIDLNGIAQGYSVDVLAAELEQRGIRNYLVELGGEIKTKGLKDSGLPFEIAIERPAGADASRFVLALTDRAVTTSGNYRKAFDYAGKSIHHHINPKDGYPVQNNVASVTVIAKTAMEADAYDNVFMALSPEQAVSFANRRKGVEIYIIYKEGNMYKEAFSKGFSNFIKKETSK